MEETSKFYIEKDGTKYTASILTNFTIYGDHYCIYTIPSIQEKQNNVYCAKIYENRLIKITDQKELDLTSKIVKQLLGN